jgi:hypothetical protein
VRLEIANILLLESVRLEIWNLLLESRDERHVLISNVLLESRCYTQNLVNRLRVWSLKTSGRRFGGGNGSAG